MACSRRQKRFFSLFRFANISQLTEKYDSIMAGGNIFGRAMSYVLNELVVDRLANSHAFQRFAVRTSKSIDEMINKAASKQRDVTEQVKEFSKNFESYKNQ
ncbi:hypothetical protein CMV_014446 [Castanea mollissima]|uniref:Uncharacterized protein n=1 Tax=Castanea mollissima TaxID=60419 RepID=A0A8J4VKX9_9ROSI|nr:hypothetical protein CMV_014446 [Castanea mollissima]